MTVKDIIKELQAPVGKVNGIYVAEGKEFNMFALLKSLPVWRKTYGKGENDIDGMMVKLSELSLTKDIMSVHREKGMVVLMVGNCNGNTSNITVEVLEHLMKIAA